MRFVVLNSIGRTSYGMYLYHMPLVAAFDRVMRMLAVPKHSFAGVLCFGVLVALTWGLAALSFAFVETPFLRLKDRFFEPRGAVAEPAVAREV